MNSKDSLVGHTTTSLHTACIITSERSLFLKHARHIFNNLRFTTSVILLLLSCFSAIGQEDVKLDFSQERGFYDAPFNLTITSENTSATIRYTLDGEEPSTTKGKIYNGAIPVETTTVLRAIAYVAGVDTSKIYTHSYLFLDDVIQQPENIAGWPNNTYDLGSRRTARHDYEMDPNIVNSAQYKDDLIKGMTDIPSMSIVMPSDDFWEIYDGEAERKMSVELLYADDDKKNEQEDGGIEPHSHDRLKRSMRLSFKSEYGAKDWDSDIFRNSVLGAETATDEFDRIVLRGGNNRAWSRNWNEDRTAFTRDEWFRQSQIASSGIGSHGTFVHLYINGVYWGLYNPVERPDEDFTSSYLGGDDDNWFAISHGGVRSGDRSRYDYLMNNLLNKNLTQSANYNELKEYLDVSQFNDYILLSWMTGVQDWPGNNWWAGNSNNPEGPLMLFGWDNEWSWDVTKNANNGAWVHPDFRANDNGGKNSALIFNKAKVNKDFMMTLVDRVYKLCFNDGPMTDENSRERWAVLNNEIENAVVAESARWGDSLEDGETRTRDEHWRNEVDRVDALMNGNVDRLISALKAEGYYPSINPPAFKNGNQLIEVTEISVTSGYEIKLQNPNNKGQIYYTTNGEDPRTSGGGIASSASVYTAGSLEISSSMNLQARVKNGEEWSALHSLNLLVAVDLSPLKITEIMYNPGDFGAVDGAELEFLEIKNTSKTASLDISGLQITDGVEYTFPTGTIMEPQSFIVLASNAEALEAKCPSAPIFGEYEGQLSNGGEAIQFSTFQGEIVLEIEYDDAAPWPIAADGEGFSLVPTEVNPTGPQDDSSEWKLSADKICASPGADDSGQACLDTDNDGICDSDDSCPNFNDNLIGTSCNDGDACTINDVYIANCECIGTFQDSDDDGICDAEDSCPNLDNDLIGTACNDSNPDTTNDVYTANCECVGTTEESKAQITRFELFDANTNTFIRVLKNNETIDLGTLGTELTVVAVVDQEVGSIRFGYDANGNFRTENIAPYTLGGDSGGNYNPIEFTVGSHVLTASAYENGRASGALLDQKTIQFIVVESCSLTGTSCNDGDYCTINDVYNADCECVGTFQDSDDDGICDVEDNCDDSLVGKSCNDGDDCTINDEYNVDCECLGTFQDSDDDGICDVEDTCDEALVGTSCNDGDDCTINDEYNADCECVGAFQDSDDDGICDAEDNCDEALVGTSCNDGDDCTINDEYNADCECIGTFQDSDDDGICDAEDNCDDSLVGKSCNDGDDCTINDEYNADCECLGTFQDSDDDGICDAEDSCPNLDNDLIGTACDDSSPDTTNDVYTANCECVGTTEEPKAQITRLELFDANTNTFIRVLQNNETIDLGTLGSELTVVAVVDQEVGSIRFGYDANNNFRTENIEPYTLGGDSGGNYNPIEFTIGSHILTASAYENRRGNGALLDQKTIQFVVIKSCPLTGTSCDDGDACTVNDVYNADCECAGTFQDSDDDGICDAEDNCDGALVGTSCNDRDACTINDVYNADCECVGAFQDSDDDGICDAEDSCPNLDNDLIGTACDDSNPDTTNDVYTANCECVGTTQETTGHIVRFELYNASTDQLIRIIDDNELVDLSVDGVELNIVAVVDKPVGSIQFGYDSNNNYRIENIAPYAMAGNNNDDYKSFTPTLGTHSLTASAYESRKAQGELLDKKTIEFTVVENCTLVGKACDDGDACTVEDAYTTDCECVGTYQDADDDGVCVGEDADDNDACVPNNTSSDCKTNNNDGLDCAVLTETGFENGNLGIWIDGGLSSRLLRSSSFANTGGYAYYIQSNDGIASSFYTAPQDYTKYESLSVTFNYYAYAVEDGDSFVLEIDLGSGNYHPLRTYTFGDDFNKNERQDVSEEITGVAFTSTVSLRFRSTATDFADYFIFDDITIEGCYNSSCTIGATCEDGDPCTVGEMIDADCNCTGGVFQDSDNDEICDAMDNSPLDPCFPNSDSAACEHVDVACELTSEVGFESGDMGIWIDGGLSARILSSASFAASGTYCFYVQGYNGSASSLFTEPQDLSGYDAIKLGFTYRPYSMESGDKFHVEVNTGNGFKKYKSYTSGVDFKDFDLNTVVLDITGLDFSSQTVFRLRIEGDHIADYVIFDDITLEICAAENPIAMRTAGEQIVQEMKLTKLYPNPAYSTTNLELKVPAGIFEAQVVMTDSWGKIVQVQNVTLNEGDNQIQLNTADFASGTYLVMIRTENSVSETKRLVILN